MRREDLLVEIGTEELPPRAVPALSRAFAEGIAAGLGERRLAHGDITAYAGPRRLAVVIRALQEQAAERETEALGPPAGQARKADGGWSRAAIGFASRHGVEPDALEIRDTDKGPRLAHRARVAGARVADCLQEIIADSVRDLPIPRRMRWGAGRTEFARPAHWAVVLYGDEVLPCEVLGMVAGRNSRGHRFHSRGAVAISRPRDYPEQLRAARVIAHFDERRGLIRQQVEALASELGGRADLDEDLLDEVAALVEWPVALAGRFEERFLRLPPESLVHTMKEHQKYFPVVGQDGRLLPRFITVANIESLDPSRVIEGNERVIRPRLSDADFFYRTDQKTPLAERVGQLESIVFQGGLGSMLDKSRRIAALSESIAEAIGANAALAQRAGLLSKADLLTEMVGEFAAMQGTAGRYYALCDGEEEMVADALEQQYWPRSAGAELPRQPVATCVALADRLDTLVGIFGIGQSPTGSRDPFALRRASLAVLRILVEGELALDLRQWLPRAAGQYPSGALADDAVERVLAYMLERFRAWYVDERIAPEVFRAVASRNLSTPLDIHHRVLAVDAFSKLPEAAALAAANRRVCNILEGLDPETLDQKVSSRLLNESAERELAAALADKSALAESLFRAGHYTRLLSSLAGLREPVDRFFDEVLVMADDEAVRNNRLRLLCRLRDLFLLVADISQLVADGQPAERREATRG